VQLYVYSHLCLLRRFTAQTVHTVFTAQTVHTVFTAQTVHTVFRRINYKIVPVTNINKYLHYGTSGTE